MSVHITPSKVTLRQCAGAVRRAQERQKQIAAGRSVKALFGLSAEELDLAYLAAAAHKLEYLFDYEEDLAAMLRLTPEQRATMRGWAEISAGGHGSVDAAPVRAPEAGEVAA